VTADEVAAALGDLVDFLVDAGAAPGGAPSTIVELVEGRPLLHRAGAVAWDRVLEFVE
jgi:tRNA A37 threonylcarbamoyladenosine synthetase subunit TsaC/SUA5/YrdC